MLLPPLREVKEKLLIQNFYVVDIYSKFGPGSIYVYDANRIRQNFERLKNAFSNKNFKTKIYFAIKSNSNPYIIKILADLGAGADCSNLNEIEIALMAGVKKEKILYSGNNNPYYELNYAIKNKFQTNFDSLSLFELVSDIKEIKDVLVCFRYNPKKGIGSHAKIITAGKNSKFGIDEKNILTAYKVAKNKGVKRFGLHMMSGSNTLNINLFLNQIKEQLKIAGRISSSLGIKFDFINIGGGFGVPYRSNQKELDINLLGKKISSEFIRGCIKNKVKASNGSFPDLILEPGRILVADSGVLITDVTNIKKSSSKKIVGLNASMATLIRPAFYGSYHHIYIDGKLNGKKIKADVVGQACESSDYFAKDRLLPKNIKIGDIAVICTAGAYCFSMSSNYCNLAKSSEVLIDNNKLRLIRRRQTLKEMLQEVNFN